MANSDVKLKHKVQLRRKIVEPDVSGNNEDTPNEPKLKAWLWISLGLILLGVIGCICFYKSFDDTTESSKQEIEAVAASPELTDTTIGVGTNVEEFAPDNGKEAATTPVEQGSNASETPAKDDNPSIASTSISTNISNDVETEAMKVIRGDYGVGQERKEKLGDQYRPIQARVNQLKREGAF